MAYPSKASRNHRQLKGGVSIDILSGSETLMRKERTKPKYKNPMKHRNMPGKKNKTKGI